MFSKVMLLVISVFVIGVVIAGFVFSQTTGVSHQSTQVLVDWKGASNVILDTPLDDISTSLTSSCPVGQFSRGFDSGQNIICSNLPVQSNHFFVPNPTPIFSWTDTSNPGIPLNNWGTYTIIPPIGCSNLKAVTITSICGESVLWFSGLNNPPSVASLGYGSRELSCVAGNNAASKDNLLVTLESNTLKYRITATNPSTLTAIAYIDAYYC